MERRGLRCDPMAAAALAAISAATCKRVGALGQAPHDAILPLEEHGRCAAIQLPRKNRLLSKDLLEKHLKARLHVIATFSDSFTRTVLFEQARGKYTAQSIARHRRTRSTSSPPPCCRICPVKMEDGRTILYQRRYPYVASR